MLCHCPSFRSLRWCLTPCLPLPGRPSPRHDASSGGPERLHVHVGAATARRHGLRYAGFRLTFLPPDLLIPLSLCPFLAPSGPERMRLVAMPCQTVPTPGTGCEPFLPPCRSLLVVVAAAGSVSMSTPPVIGPGGGGDLAGGSCSGPTVGAGLGRGLCRRSCVIVWSLGGLPCKVVAQPCSGHMLRIRDGPTAGRRRWGASTASARPRALPQPIAEWASHNTQHTTTTTTQHNTTQHNTTQHNTTQHNTTQHNTTQHNTTQHNTTQHNTTTDNRISWRPAAKGRCMGVRQAAHAPGPPHCALPPCPSRTPGAG
jgi:hypothetical protein